MATFGDKLRAELKNQKKIKVYKQEENEIIKANEDLIEQIVIDGINKIELAVKSGFTFCLFSFDLQNKSSVILDEIIHRLENEDLIIHKTRNLDNTTCTIQISL